jgi:hypothetical protein
MDRLVDIKKINIMILKNAITKPILEKFYAMFFELKNNYANSEESADMKNLLKQFQFALSHITNWDETKRTNITNELINKLNEDRERKKYDNLHIENLIKTIIKSNLEIFYFNNPENIDVTIYENLNLPSFVNHIFTSCARKFHEQPYLFIDELDKIKKIKNKYISKQKIEESIDEIIIEMVDINALNINFLNDKLNNNHGNQDIKNTYNTLSNDKQLNNFNKKDFNHVLNGGTNNILFTNNNDNNDNNNNNNNNYNKRQDDNNNFKKSIENKFNNILKEKEIKLRETKKYKTKSSLISQITKDNNNNNNNNNYNNYNDKNTESSSKKKNIKHILEKDLKDTENKEMYNAEDDTDKYREVFSNSINTEFKNNDSELKKTSDKLNIKSKNKFFNNYLNL